MSLEIRESILRNLTEISKHYSIRAAILNRKLFSKIMKGMYEHLQLTLAKKPPQQQPSQPASPVKKSKVSEGEESQKENLARTAVDEGGDGNGGGGTPEIHSRKMMVDESKGSLERNQGEREQIEVRVLQSYVSLIISLGSITNNKFYIPGETKEVEALRRKAIMNGILVFVQAIINLIIGSGDVVHSGISDAMKRLQYELLETVDAPHFRLHLYTVHSILKQRVTNMKSSENNPQLEIEKDALHSIIETVGNERLYVQLKITLEH